MLIARKRKKSTIFLRFSKPLKVYKLKEFEAILKEKGFNYHHQNGSHRIYLDSAWHYITVPNGKEVNAMLSTVILQRLSRNNLKTLDKETINRYKNE